MLKPVSSAVTGAATRSVPQYFVFAVSGGFNRNNHWGKGSGPNFQGAINDALADCKKHGGVFCEVDQYCLPPQLAPSRPWVSISRSSVYNPLPLDRGVTGFACGKTSRAAAEQLALGQCAIHGCTTPLSVKVIF